MSTRCDSNPKLITAHSLQLPHHSVRHPRRCTPLPARSRSALEWIIERYQIKTDSNGSGIVNDPNTWCEEHNDPRYIIDLIKRIITVSITTMSIVEALLELNPQPMQASV